MYPWQESIHWQEDEKVFLDMAEEQGEDTYFYTNQLLQMLEQKIDVLTELRGVLTALKLTCWVAHSLFFPPVATPPGTGGFSQIGVHDSMFPSNPHWSIWCPLDCMSEPHMNGPPLTPYR